jgi:Bifunctional DNA primase/polymerase, N-terminal/Primase C terminal 1 (PriCT-1)
MVEPRTLQGNYTMTSLTTNMLDAALRYAKVGLPVFPLWPALPLTNGFTCGCGKASRCDSPAKHPLSPLVPNGLKSATTDIKAITDWWTTWPEANVAIATGKVVVVDIDPRHGGDAALAQIEAKHGALPPTWRVKTGGGGLHIYFAAYDNIMVKNSAGLLGAGLDVRGHGGYVVAPPSRHISGGLYEWAAGKNLAPMPDWLIAALQEPRTKVAARSDDWRQLVRDGVTEGKRNDAAARLAGHLLRRYVDPHVALELLMAWNITRCAPPLAPPEIITIVNSIAKRELARRQAP